MGCSQNKPQSIQQRITDIESHLLFPSIPISSIQQIAEDYVGHVNVITLKNMKRMLSNLDINYNCQDEKIFKAFFGSFFVYEDEDEEKEYYNFPRFMTATYLLANDSQEAKASAIFDIFSDCHGTIRLERLESVITEIVEVVRSYTRRLLKVDASSLHLQEIKTRNKMEILISKVVDFGHKCFKVPLSRQNFIDLVKRVSNVKGFPNLMNLSSFAVEVIQIELQTYPCTPDKEKSSSGRQDEEENEYRYYKEIQRN